MRTRAWLVLLTLGLSIGCGSGDGSIKWPPAADGAATDVMVPPPRWVVGGPLDTAADLKADTGSLDIGIDVPADTSVPADLPIPLIPDMASPDVAADTATPDLAPPDLAPPIFMNPDAAPDLATPDAADVASDTPAVVTADMSPDVTPDTTFDVPPDIMLMDVSPDIGPTDLVLTRSKARINVWVRDYATITAQVTQIGKDAGAGASHAVAFSTNLGTFVDTNGTILGTTVTTYTDSLGQTSLRLTDTGVTGTATVTIMRPQASAAQITVDITPVTLSWDKTTCNGVACNVMGIKNSGYNEKAQITFKLSDSMMMPIGGANLVFSAVNFPVGAKMSPTAITDPSGNGVVEVESGPITGAFTLRATIMGAMQVADSPIIGMRGAKPSNRGFSFQCSPVNIGAYASASPPLSVNVTCTVKLVDRFGNPIGTGAPVYLRAEAGSIPFSTDTKAFDPLMPQIEGIATTQFSTVGVWPPQDVGPLAAAAGQWPKPRTLEPSVMDGALRYNPRDGLVSLVAYVKGEEFFQDDNSNGMRDPSEMFIDQGEPFVDSNDNGTWDAGEAYVDDAPTDGMWTAPNGVWDTATTIWAETRLLYTGRQDTLTQTPPTYSLAIGSSQTLTLAFSDKNLNLPQSMGTTISCAHVGRGTLVTSPTREYQDSFGFGMERWLVNAADKTECTAATPICNWSMLFFNWPRGYSSSFMLAGSTTATAMPPTVQSTTTCNVTVLGVSVSIVSSGPAE